MGAFLKDSMAYYVSCCSEQTICFSGQLLLEFPIQLQEAPTVDSRFIRSFASLRLGNDDAKALNCSNLTK